MKKKFPALLFALLFVFQSFAEVKTASIFGDNMVLQRDMPLPVWGEDVPGTMVVVSFNDFEAETFAGPDGRWRLLLPALSAGGPYELTVSGTSTKTYTNVMVGEVWFMSGQSNMQMTVKSSNDAEAEIAAANHPGIRMFKVAAEIGGEPLGFLSKGEKWEVCSPETVGGFSAAAYYFGRELQEKYNVPVGLINSSWGGTNIESWISGDMLYSMPETRPYIEWVREKKIDYVQKRKENELIYLKIDSIIKNARKGEKEKVGLPGYDDSLWKTMNVPVHFHNTPLSGYEGFVWFRKSFELPAGYTGKGLELTLGKIEQSDETFFNAAPVGKETNTGRLRQYFIPAKEVRKGTNAISVKVLHRREEGGGMYEGPFTLTDKGSGAILLDLSGEWKYNENIETKLPKAPHYHWHLSTIYNYMVAPIIPFGIKGVVWYQGENNTDASYHYRTLLEALITDWRVQWRQGYFPFVVVQLPMFRERDPEPSEHGWTELRESQATATGLPHVALAVTVDTGDSLDIHPRDKQEVGHRIFLAAQSAAYDPSVVSSGPVYKGYVTEGNKIRIRFDRKGNKSILSRQTPLSGFAIAGADRKFYWADAVLEGDEVVVESALVPDPVAVRYAWSPNPALSLFGDSGLPVLPFRTDEWEGVTYGKTKKYDRFHQ